MYSPVTIRSWYAEGGCPVNYSGNICFSPDELAFSVGTDLRGELIYQQGLNHQILR